MHIAEVSDLAGRLEGVRESGAHGVLRWSYHGRLVARQQDEDSLVVRADFEFRDTLLRRFPGTFRVPRRFARHMMVVADLSAGDPGAIEEALVAAWELQRAAD